MCYTYIYDTLENPFHITHKLRAQAITDKSQLLKISDAFIKIMSKIDIIELFTKFNSELPLEEYTEVDEYTDWLWSKVQFEYSKPFAELYEELQEIVKENNMGFIKHKFRIIAASINSVHKAHITKEYQIQPSLGPVPFDQLVAIRVKAGLPVPKFRSDSVLNKPLSNIIDHIYY
jgi:hypothetical protein